MEVFGILIGIVLLAVVIKWLQEWTQSINWGIFFSFLIGGGVLLALLFSFTAEGVLVIIGAYIVLAIIALFMGAFKK